MLEQNVYETIIKEKLIENGDKIVLGVSGGPDSICMLTILNKIANEKLIDFKIVVAHINHGLRENAILDEKYVKDFCEKINVPFFVKHLDIKKIATDQKRGLEETGRIERYKFFEEIKIKINCNKIAIAHNKNDKVETIIMNLLRGTGTKGLIGIEMKNGQYIRPLLNFKRTEIEEYLLQNNIQARHDETNDENIYTRNKIRNIVIPYIEREFNPNFIENFSRLSTIVQEEEKYFQKQTEKIYNEICIQENNNSEIIIDLKKFNSKEKVIQKRIIFYSINKLFGTTNGIEKIHIDDIIKLCNNNIGNKYLMPNKNTKVLVEKKQLKIMVINNKI